MAWGRKAERIADLEKQYRKVCKELTAEEAKGYFLEAERDVAKIDAKAFKRKAADFEKAKKVADDRTGDQADRIRRAQARVHELEWAVQLLNVACARTGDGMGSPLTGVNPPELETAREAVRERDIVVKWDDLTGKPEVHFPKKDERAAPWRDRPMIAFHAGDFIYGHRDLVDPA